MQNIILLDLEETVIADLFSTGTSRLNRPVFLDRNIEKIKKYIRDNEITNPKFGIMSWALYDEDLKDFKEFVQSGLEDRLGATISNELIITIEGWLQKVWTTTGMMLDKTDAFTLFKKPEILFALSQRSGEFSQSRVILFDDAIKNVSIFSHDSFSIVHLVNINTLE
jgi:hypothetical protein